MKKRSKKIAAKASPKTKKKVTQQSTATIDSMTKQCCEMIIDGEELKNKNIFTV